MNNKKKILYIDMDNCLVDFQSGIDQLSEELFNAFKGNYDLVPGIFGLMKPMDGAVEAFEKLAAKYDVYILSTAPWENPTAWSDKLLWTKKYLGKSAYKRLTLSHNKHLSIGDFLIDDRLANGAGEFEGELIRFGSERFPNWKVVLEYLLN